MRHLLLDSAKAEAAIVGRDKSHKMIKNFNYIVIFTIHINLLFFSSCNPSLCLTKPANKIKKIDFINETEKLKLNYGLSLYMPSTGPE